MPRRPATDVPSAPSQAGPQSRFDLSALFEFSAIVNSALELPFILSHYLLTIMGKLLSLRGMVLLRKGDATYVVEHFKGLPETIRGQSLTIRRLPRTLTVLKESGAAQEWHSFFTANGMTLLLPLAAGKTAVGLAAFGLSPLKKKLSKEEEEYVKSLTNIAASAIEKGIVFGELRDVNRKLDRKLHEMSTLFELGKEFNAILDADRLVKMLMLTMMGQIGANRYFLCLEHGKKFAVAASRLDAPVPPGLLAAFPRFTGAVAVENLTRKGDREVKSACEALAIRALIPLVMQGDVRGVIGLGAKLGGAGYEAADLEFLTSLGNLAMISLENARLFREAIEKQKMEDELLIAKDIQRGLLPKSIPPVPGFAIAATNISSKQVGGDYYDIIPIDDHRFVLAIGDVSGKGTPASLLMANLQATIRALVPLGLPLGELTGRVNDLLCENTGTDRFITFFWGILDIRERRFRYVNAGHNPPYLVRADGAL